MYIRWENWTGQYFSVYSDERTTGTCIVEAESGIVKFCQNFLIAIFLNCFLVPKMKIEVTIYMVNCCKETQLTCHVSCVSLQQITMTVLQFVQILDIGRSILNVKPNIKQIEVTLYMVNCCKETQLTWFCNLCKSLTVVGVCGMWNSLSKHETV